MRNHTTNFFWYDAMHMAPSRSKLGLLGLLLVLFASAGCHNPYKSGLEALGQDRYTAAEQQATELLAEAPEDPRYHLLMADALVGQSEFREAEPHARKAFESGQLDATAGRTLGKVLWELGQPIAAVEAWRAARAADRSSVSDEDFVRALETALAMALSIREFEKALDLRGELQELKPNHPESAATAFQRNRMQLAEELVREGKYEDAGELYEGLAEETGDAIYHFDRARLMARLGRQEEASEAFQKFVDAGTEDERVDRSMTVARRAERLGALTLAVEFYDKAIKSMPDKPSMERAGTHLRLAALLLSARATDQGKAHLRSYISDRRVLQGEPVSAGIYLQAAQTATRNRSPEIAIELLEEAIVVAAPHWRATRKLAELYARRARTNDVERVLKKYVERSQSSVSAQVAVGRWAAGRRNFELARFFLESAVEADESSPSIWLELARVYSALGRMDEVRRTLTTYVKKVDDERRALLDVASIYRGQRMYDEAEDALRKLFKKDPTDLNVARQLETLYQEWGKPKQIHDVYDRWLKAGGNQAADYMLVGERFQRQNEWDDALPYFRQAAKRGENDAWLQIADIFKRQRKTRDMAEALQKYLDGADKREPALNAAWQRYKTTAWRHEAIPILEELIKLDSRNVMHYEELSKLYFEQGRDVEAFELWKQYIELSRDPLRSLEQMADRFQRQGHNDWMLAFLHQILEKHSDPDPRVYKLLGDAYSPKRTRRISSNKRLTNSIFSDEDKARRYYTMYLEKAEPTRRELQQFAAEMRQNQVYDVAARAYEKLDLSSPIHTHQLLNYGDVLLNLGRADEALAVFEKYYERRGGSVDAARRIADQLQSHSRYVAIEPYLKKMMDSGDENLLKQAFMTLGQAYRQTDRPAEIVPLIGEYLSKTQNPSEARRTVLDVLEAAGMWEEAVRQLERVAETQGEEARFELGVMYYKRGNPDEADEALRDFASASVTPAEAWLRVARFYEAHAEIDAAGDAFNLAVSSAPQNHQILADRGRFRIISGRIDDGRADFTQARGLVGQSQKGPLTRVEVEALVTVGRYKEASEAARSALSTTYVDRDYFYKVIAISELDTSDEVKRERMVDELQNAGLDVSTLVNLLVDYGFIEDAAVAIRGELRNGDFIVAGNLMITHAQVFTEIGGMESLLREIQPLIERNPRDGRLAASLGEYLVREGHYDRGALMLRSALDRGVTNVRPLLARTYLSQGHYDEASRMYQAHLAAQVPEGRETAIVQMAQEYELSGERDRLMDLLSHLAQDTRFAAAATPLLVRELIQTNRVREATAKLVGLWEIGPATEMSGLQISEDDEIDSVVVGGIEALAAEGYEAEALAVLDRVPQRMSDNESIRDLRLRLANASELMDTEKEVELALMKLGDSAADATQKLRIAELMMIGQHYALSEKIATPFLDSGDYDVARSALRILLATGEAQGDRSNFEAHVGKFVDTHPDKVWSRTVAMLLLLDLGADELATRLARKNFEMMPSESNVMRALDVAQITGDSRLMQDSLNAYWRVRRNPANELPPKAARQVFTGEVKDVEKMLVRFRDAYPEVWSARESSIELRYRSGEPERARDEILDYLEGAEFDPQGVDVVLRVMRRLKLWGDMAMFLGPKLDEEKLTPYSRRMLGIAHLELGLKDRAISMLDRYVETAVDGPDAASELTWELLMLERPQAALRYGELAVQRRPGREKPYLFRGLARLANDDLVGAREDFEASIDNGLGRSVALYRIGVVALRKRHDALAFEYLGRLANAPSSGQPLDNFRLAMAAFQTSKRQDAGVTFAEKNFPKIASGMGATAVDTTQIMSALYESAGKVEQTIGLYERGIRENLISQPFDNGLSTYRNNLAYVFSTSDQRIDEGLAMVRLAIASEGKRNGSYIDTVGWLLYRKGEFVAAEDEIRRALRSTVAAPSSLVELYSHLAELRAKQGYARDANWLQIFIDSVE